MKDKVPRQPMPEQPPAERVRTSGGPPGLLRRDRAPRPRDAGSASGPPVSTGVRGVDIPGFIQGDTRW